MSTISGSRILITGGASGLGRLMALKLAEKGGEVIIWDIHGDGVDAVVRESAEAPGAPIFGYTCDVSKRREVYDRARQVMDERGPVDILVNNAGVVSGQGFLDLPDEEIERTFAVNTLALFWTTKAFLPGMMERGRGHVVTVASAAGWIGVRGLADYSASKFAAVGFDESLRVELKKRAPAIRTTLVCPYFVDTGMFDGVKTRFPLILPILKDTRVASAIVRAIEGDRPRLMMPPIVYTVPLLRILPVSVFDTISDALGINVSMSEFKGRAREAPPTG